MNLPKRKPNRLAGFEYSTPGAYFITICVEGKRCILSSVVGGGAFDAPQMRLTELGKIAEKHIITSNRLPNVCVEKYVIMPNHIHLLLAVSESDMNGSSRAPTPTNEIVPRFVSTLKRFCHREAGERIFQRSYHDHIIRNQRDYDEIWQHIDNNPLRWKEDCFYKE